MSVRYFNQTAPFWDFVANFEEQQSSRAAGAGAANETPAEGNEHPEPYEGAPWGFPFMFGHPGGRRYGRGHGRAHHPHPHHHAGPSHGHPAPPPPPEGEPSEKEPDAAEGPSDGPAPPPPDYEHLPHHGPGFRRGRCGPRNRGSPFGNFPHHPPPPPHNPFGSLQNLAEMFQTHLFGSPGETDGTPRDESFKPDVDVFDTAEAFVVHLSLAGAKKEDVAVNWDADKSELSITGVVYRPGDEEFLKTLAMDERKVGLFERKVRLGSRANPAQVDVDGIAAKLEDGVLRVNVPKLDSGYVEIRKVDIE